MLGSRSMLCIAAAVVLVLSGFVAVALGVGSPPPAAGRSAGTPSWDASVARFGTSTATSTNWAGYVVPSSNGAVTDVKGSWFEPRFHGSCGGLYNFSAASFWVGIDGWNSNTVEQVGTSVECLSVLYVSSISYFAWYEFYPAAPVTLALTITPGDHLSGEVSYSTATSSYAVSLKDLTTGTASSVVVTGVSANRSSAEWIAEAPTGSSGILPLVDFSSVHFSASSATISKQTHPVAWFSNYAVTMWNGAGTAQKATPSALSSTGRSFVVGWRSYGP